MENPKVQKLLLSGKVNLVGREVAPIGHIDCRRIEVRTTKLHYCWAVRRQRGLSWGMQHAIE